MVQLNKVILPSWMPFISKDPQLILTTNKNQVFSYDNDKNEKIFTIQDYLNVLSFSDQLILNFLKDHMNYNKIEVNLKNEIFTNFWNWTFQICWIIRCTYLKEFNLEFMTNSYEQELDLRPKENNIIRITPPEFLAITNRNSNMDIDIDHCDYEVKTLLEILNLHQNLCLELSNFKENDSIDSLNHNDNEKKIFCLWWFMTFNLLKILNKILSIYDEQELDGILRGETIENEKSSLQTLKNITLSIANGNHSGGDYFPDDLLSYANYFLNSLEGPNLLLFFKEDAENQNTLLNLLKDNDFKCVPTTFNSFTADMKNSEFYKERSIYNSIKSSKDIKEFTITKELGKGSSGFVRSAIHIQTGKQVIIKYVVKSLILRGCWTTCKESYKRFPNEITVLQYIHDQYNGDVPKNLTKLITYWEDSIYYYLVFADTGDFDSDLFDYIDKTSNVMMSEKEAKLIFKNIVKAIQILHHNNIVHRDIKDENVLINYKTKNIQLIDFGSSSLYKDGQKLSNFVGSFLFAAPEIIKGMTYDGPPQDIWSLGILLYTMIYKVTPFHDYYEILRKKIIFPKTISNECKELILWMTNRNITQRPTIDQVLSHPWFNE